MQSLRISCAFLVLWATTQAPAAVARELEAPPGLELLEFLGEWETDDGEPIDPLDLNAGFDPGRQEAGTSGRSRDRGRRETPAESGKSDDPRHEDDPDATLAD